MDWLAPTHARANDNDDIAREFAEFEKEAEKLLKQVEERTKTIDTSPIGDVRVKAMTLAADEKFLNSVTDLWKHPKRETLLWIELGFLIVMFLFKAWRQSKTSHWFKRLLIGFVIGWITWAIAILVIPYFVLGEPFKIVVMTLWNVLRS